MTRKENAGSSASGSPALDAGRRAALCVLLALGICAWSSAYGQITDHVPQAASQIGVPLEDAPEVLSRILGPVDESRLVQLRGNTHPHARSEFDQGPVDHQLPMERMLLLLKRSPEQAAALEAFMARQLDPASRDFHRWLDPVEFGRRYGPSDSDISAVTNWLQNHGFRVDRVTNGRVFIEFSGTAGLVQTAFHTEIHRYNMGGEEHFANNSDPSIPEALSPVVAGIVSLHNFFSKPLHRDLGAFERDSKTGKWKPENQDALTRPLFNVAVTGGTFELVSPYDFATIYNVLPLWNAGIDGTGQTIAIAGRSDISLTDVANFRSAFGLPAKAPTIIVNGPDPGIPSPGDKVENTLDVEWSGAVAKGATIKFVTTASTTTSDGASASAIYIIDNKVAPILSFSYGNCELAYGTAGNAAANTLWQQGAAEGITEFVASGDQGAAACDGGQAAPYEAQFALAVSGPSSTPYNVAVGGTDLNWANSTTTYWSSTNASNGLSALGHIPEVPWNGSCASDDVDILIGATALGWDEETTCQQILLQGVDTSLVNSAGGTGGRSACTTPSSNTVASCSGGYAKPSWQTGTGVPADGKRDVPDVSLFASSGVLNSAYVICDSDTAPCTFSNPSDALAQGVGGTSVASPAMAGIMALILQKIGGTAQGQANPVFYKLAAKDTLSTCNATTVATGNSCIFYDVTTDNIAVPCSPGSPDCTVHHTGDTVGIPNGYTSTTGYDLATGLGSVNAFNLVNAWPATAIPTATLTPTSLSFASTPVGAKTAAQILTLKNTGTVALSIAANGIAISGADYTSFARTTTCPVSATTTTTLAAGASCTISIDFNPQAVGTLTATLGVTDNATGSPQKTTLTGTGTAAVVTATLTPASLTFANTKVGSTTAAQIVTLKNTSATSTLTINTGGITIAATGATSYIKTTTCGTTLGAGASCTVSVSFKPVTTGTLTATLSVADNATGSPQKVTLTGTGISATTLSITLSPTTLTFPNTVLATTSAAQLVTVTNSGSGSVTLSSISIAGTNPTSFLQLNTCGTTLAAGASCGVFLAFKPVSATALKATLSVADTATGSPQTVAHSGTGTATDSVTLSTGGLTFPLTVRGTTSEAQGVTLTNAGTSPLNITSISLAGLDPSSFIELNTCGPTLALAAKCVIYVAFKPAATGTLTASLSIGDTGKASPQTVTLTGTGR
jgi:subtilase family serine protease